MMRTALLTCLSFIATVAALGVSMPALAVDAAGVAAAPQSGLEEIVVTARKREENLQKAPLAITALTAADIHQTTATNLPDLAKFTPSLTFSTTSYDPFSNFVCLRGQCATDVLLESEPSVGLYVDGVYVGNTLGTNVSGLLGVDRVEVLKGPQGTLYGRNTTGGAVSIVTSLPNYDGVAGAARLRYGNYQTVEATADVNLPIVNNLLSARIGVDYLDQGKGFGTDVTSGRPLGNPRSTNIRGALRFDPTSNLEFVLRGDFSLSASNGFINRLVAVQPGSPATIQASVELASAGKLVSPAFSGSFLGALFPVLTGHGTPAQFAIFGQGITQARTDMLNSVPANRYDSALNGGASLSALNSGVNLKTYGESLTGTYDFGNDISLKSITSYRRLLRNFQIDSDGSPFTIINSPIDTTNENQFAQEFDLNGSALSNRLKYVAGLFYYYLNGDELQTTYAIPAINPLTPSITEANVRDTSKAVFGQATYALTDALNLTGGIRETKETKTLLSRNSQGAGAGFSCQIASADQIGGKCLGRFSNSFNSFSYTASLDYSFTNDTLGYIRTGKGFKAGGQNERLGLVNSQFANFAPETATDYEIGMKTDFLDKHLRVNADFYHTKYASIQETVIVPTPAGVTSIIANAGGANINGIELDVQALPIDALLLRLSGAWTKPTYTSGEPHNSEGRFANVPEWQGTFSAVYTMPTPIGDARVGGDYTYQTLVDFDPANHSATSGPYNYQAGYGLVNARVSLTLSRSKTEIALYGKNLADKYYLTGALDVIGAGLGTVTNFVGNPRTYGVEITQPF